MSCVGIVNKTHLMSPYPSDSQMIMTLSLSELEARYRPSLLDHRTQSTAPKYSIMVSPCAETKRGKGVGSVKMCVSHTAVPS